MENYHSAFLPGEYARLQSRALLEQLQQKYTGDPSQFGLHTVVPPNMAEFADQRVRITGRSYYHFGWVLYELEGLPDCWPEAALVDQQLFKSDDPDNQPANLTYIAVKSDDGQFVDICTRDGVRYCSYRRHDVDASVKDINRVAKLRTRSSFSSRYEFDGVEYDDNPKLET
ncbi:hypothetical protein [Rubinisphaera sp.]|uniref:hypothetical protein n=1 Tax=Rubinisphaera sp. TaxID=2024857 RepID=UPI000C0DD1E7|nr:hypothetical protein [Rubinisphaera sp.]MBV11179.1 hypothetical protein [Rubinisphaera sp.]HCS50749.1 hypothetical protein [Planctomycetaceae bacterium]|tara:strand:- start:1350 stop:1862 length:513 start_codon:yes stop_codon:yes gene_type:complete